MTHLPFSEHVPPLPYSLCVRIGCHGVAVLAEAREDGEHAAPLLPTHGRVVMERRELAEEDERERESDRDLGDLMLQSTDNTNFGSLISRRHVAANR
jgi:hypothetical protein